MRVLDLFCGAGGAAMGLHQAWPDAEIVGVDIKRQPRYPFQFVQADAMTYQLEGFDFYWASPPCQAYSEATPIAARAKHPDLIAPIRKRLEVTGKPYIIENVDCARLLLRNAIMLCGTMFGLKVWRHRWFETHPVIPSLRPPCRHDEHPVVVSGSAHGRGEAKVPEMIEAMCVPWMEVRSEVRQAIPPAFSRWLAKHISIRHYPEEWTDIKGAKQLTCACGDADPFHAIA